MAGLRRRRRQTWTSPAPGALIIVLATTVAASLAAPARGGTPGPLPATVVFGDVDRAIPPGFTGLSLEMNEIGRYVRTEPVFARVTRLVGADDGHSILVRLGGRSADFAYWNTRERGPRWVQHYGPVWMRAIAQLAVRDRLRVMVDTNLVVHAPTMAVAFARTAARMIPRSRLAGIIVGNEPHLYRYMSYFERERVHATLRGTRRHWTRAYSPDDYRQDWLSYAEPLARALPAVPLVGSEAGLYERQWPAVVAGLGALRARILSIHYYSYCADPRARGTRGWPSIRHLLGEFELRRMVAAISADAAVAAANGDRLQLTEYNTVCCGGPRGTSDSFATALYAPDALFAMVRAGLEGVAFHVRPRMRSAAFELLRHGIFARPELYGIAVWASLVTPGARLMQLRVEQSGLPLKPWAVWTPKGVNLLLINKGRRLVRVSVPVAPYGTGSATTELLTAPAPWSVRGVTFAGRSIGSDARWHGHKRVERLTAAGSAYPVLVPPYSASVVRLHRANDTITINHRRRSTANERGWLARPG